MLKVLFFCLLFFISFLTADNSPLFSHAKRNKYRIQSHSSFAAQFSKEHFIDLSKDSRGYGNVPCPELARNAFNWSLEISTFVSYLQDKYNIQTAIETGTSTGNTTAFLACAFDKVHTIEINEMTFNQASENLKTFPNVVRHLGSSEKVLSDILPDLQEEPVIFYLDAHWNEYWPLLDELRAISETHYDNCIIIIDDFKIPGRADLPFDSYGDHSCCYEYIREELSHVYSEYDFYFVIPIHPSSHGKFLAIPKKWNRY